MLDAIEAKSHTTEHVVSHQAQVGPSRACRHRTLILSTSNHWTGISEDKYAIMTVNVMKYLHDNFRGLMVYVRSSVPGHPSCDKALGPYSDNLYKHGVFYVQLVKIPCLRCLVERGHRCPS